MKILVQKIASVRQREWKSERFQVLAALILQTTHGTTRAQDIRKRLTQRMDMWDKGKYDTLVDETDNELLRRASSGRRTHDDESAAQQFNATVLSGRLRKAVRGLTNRDGEGVLQPDYVCTKTGRRVLEVLREKHPAMRDPDLTGPDPRPLIHLCPLRMLCFSISRRLTLRRSLRSSRGVLVVLDKQPGVRPVGIGEIFRRLIDKCVLAAVGHRAMEACGNLNLCAGWPSGRY